MSYLVLARKHRPANFDEVIGQEHITDLLKKAIQSNRVAHAYLFCGPRGVGKTSCARILAKCLNCQDGPSVKPSKEDSICREIDQGTAFDVLEIDGASNRGIDEVRTLRENVKFAPSTGRYKIYIVDEVHMLTTEAFNALLKTLEEPPEHVKFIFATTDVNKVPATIISRCQRFDFKRIPLKTIIQQLTDICKKEKFKVDEDALLAIGKAAEGSLRDSLSILDQLSALSDSSIKAEDVFSMLGVVETSLLFELTDAVGDRNSAEALRVLDQIIDKGKDAKQLNKDLIEHFRNLMIIKVGGKSLGRLVDYPVAIKEMYLAQSKKFSVKEILDAIDLFIKAQDMARITESVRIPLEISIAKLAYSENVNVDDVLPKATETRIAKKPSPAAVLKSQKGQADFSMDDDDDDLEETGEAEPAEPVAIDEADEGVELSLEQIKKSWDVLTFAVSREKMSLATYLQEGHPVALNDATLRIGFPSSAQFHMESLIVKDNKRLIEKIFSEKLRTTVLVEFVLSDVNESQGDREPVVQEAIDTFQGKIVSKWHKE